VVRFGCISYLSTRKERRHRLDNELYLQCLFWALCHVMCTAVLIGRDPATTPHPHPPRIGTRHSYTRTLLVSKNRRHLFVTPMSAGLFVFQSEYYMPTAPTTVSDTSPICAPPMNGIVNQLSAFSIIIFLCLPLLVLGHIHSLFRYYIHDLARIWMLNGGLMG
jgi:hypothetical protein